MNAAPSLDFAKIMHSTLSRIAAETERSKDRSLVAISAGQHSWKTR